MVKLLIYTIRKSGAIFIVWQFSCWNIWTIWFNLCNNLNFSTLQISFWLAESGKKRVIEDRRPSTLKKKGGRLITCHVLFLVTEFKHQPDGTSGYNCQGSWSNQYNILIHLPLWNLKGEAWNIWNACGERQAEGWFLFFPFQNQTEFN